MTVRITDPRILGETFCLEDADTRVHTLQAVVDTVWRHIQLARGAAFAVLILALAASAPANAFEVKLYDFKITRLDVPFAGVVFDDTFADDGTPPPSAPNFVNAPSVSAQYIVAGSYPSASEVGGYLLLNSAYGAVGPTTAAGGVLVANQRARLDTDTNPATSFGFKQSKAFVVDARFDLVDPGGGNILTGYGIAFVDPFPSKSTVNFMALNVGGGPTGPVLRFVYVDNVGIIVAGHPDLYPLGEVPLTAGGLIDLRLEKTIAGGDLVQAFYSLDGVNFNEIADTNPDADARIFRDVFQGVNVNWTLAEFRAFAAVPEPATVALIGVALASLVFSRRRRLH